MMMSEFSDLFEDDSIEDFITCHENAFFNKCIELKLIDTNTKGTLFVAESISSEFDVTSNFNAHICDENIQITGPGEQFVLTKGPMQYALRIQNDNPLQAGIGYRKFTRINLSYYNLTVHFIEEPLPVVRFKPGVLQQFLSKNCLSGTNADIKFQNMSIPISSRLTFQFVPLSGEEENFVSHTVLWEDYQSTVIRLTIPIVTKDTIFNIRLLIGDNISSIVCYRNLPYNINVFAIDNYNFKPSIAEITPDKGSIDSKICIWGDNFLSHTSVFFDSVPAIIYKFEKSFICCIVPVVNPTSAEVTVQNGTIKSNAVSFQVLQ